MGKKALALQQELNKIKQELLVAKASTVFNHILCASQVKYLLTKDFTASGMVLHVTALNGSDLIQPVMINNGLSKEALAAIHADIVRSHAYLMEHGPLKPLNQG